MSENVSKLIDALQSGDMAAANAIFRDDIASRVGTTLDQAKVAVAGQVFGSADEIDTDYVSDEELEAAAEDVIDHEEEIDYEQDVELEDSEEE